MDAKPADWVVFEDDVFNHVEKCVKRGRLSVNPSRSKVYRKRKYYSQSRKADIEFEIAIESFDEGTTEPSLVWIWECKRHRRPVEVGDVESLNDKIEQLGRSRFKGTIVTTNGFQQSAKERAISCGISLFLLKKELQRVTKYGREQPLTEWVETIVVPEGVTFGGVDCGGGARLADAQRRCLREIETTALGVETMSGESFESLWECCCSNKRAIPKEWNKFYKMLANKRRVGNGWEPAAPLILAAWNFTMPLEKHLRFKVHVQWASDNGQIEEIGKYLRSLPEDDWYHFGEL